ncbi:hypothetical protein SEA_FRANSOYER_78 [Microbacterium phage Fransoyer]|nr:hypothetical protein SEA_FRANSOYER_78 [Microbacterium phage Fransoyer]
MKILIDEQLAVEVNSYTAEDEDGESVTLVDGLGVSTILSTWESLAPGRRGFRQGRDDSDSEPATIYVSEASNNHLEMFDLSTFWDGSMEHNAFRLIDLEDTLPIEVVES